MAEHDFEPNARKRPIKLPEKFDVGVLIAHAVHEDGSNISNREFWEFEAKARFGVKLLEDQPKALDSLGYIAAQTVVLMLKEARSKSKKFFGTGIDAFIEQSENYLANVKNAQPVLGR